MSTVIRSMDDDDRCTICGAKEGAVDNLVNSQHLTNAVVRCGHRFCQRCIDKEFLQKRQFYCGVCGAVVKSNTLTHKSVLEIEAERDFKIRKKIKEIFNKTETDFPSHLEFCDYEEMVEDIIYNLTESIDVDETNRRVEEYKKQNADLIVAQRTKQLEQMRNQQSSIEMEKKSIESSLLDMQVANARERKAKIDLINQTNHLMLGDTDSVQSIKPSRFMAFPGSQQTEEKSSTAMAPPGRPIIKSNHVQLFFLQREPPSPIFTQARQLPDPDAAMAAGGYTNTSDLTFKRNLNEALKCFQFLSHKWS